MPARLALLMLFVALACQAKEGIPSPQSARCEPTIARMVPPQFVMDHVLGGIQRSPGIPNPTVPVPRELWAADKNYLGKDGLWLALPRDGKVRGLKVSITEYQATPGRVLVSAHRLDGPGTATIDKDENPGGGPRDRAATIHFSTSGCWEIFYTLADIDLRFVLSVEAR